jgi:hypothetical protein
VVSRLDRTKVRALNSLDPCFDIRVTVAEGIHVGEEDVLAVNEDDGPGTGGRGGHGHRPPRKNNQPRPRPEGVSDGEKITDLFFDIIMAVV